jgi:hypothetical protein
MRWDIWPVFRAYFLIYLIGKCDEKGMRPAYSCERSRKCWERNRFLDRILSHKMKMYERTGICYET